VDEGHKGETKMIELRKITFENFSECLDLRVEEDQGRFVASIIYTLAELYVVITNKGSFIPMPYAIYFNDKIVGFIAMSYVISESENSRNYYDIYRFMIDKRYQHKGYGRKAIEKSIELLRTLPHGKASEVMILYSPENKIARKLYSSLGFIETGELDEDGEILAKLVL
jgi:diamine N-acetyltransferase